MRGWVAGLLLLGCRAPEGVQPEPGVAVVSLLRAPFDGAWPMSNPFDHRAPPAPPGEGEVLDRFGRPALGTRGHRAYDWPLDVGTPVRSAGDGVVIQAGPVPAFQCALLGREVDDQLAVVVEHQGPGGLVWRTGYHHLASVAVSAGAVVRAGDLLGPSGGSGCVDAPHLHFTVERMVGDVAVPVDPFGWASDQPDPWEDTTGLPSLWLWRPGEAPPWIRERRVVDGGPVRVPRVRYQVWPGQLDGVDLTVDAGGPTSLAGWRIQIDGVDRWRGGDGAVSPGTTTLRLDPEELPDAGGVLRLVDPEERVQQELRWGLASRRAPEPAGARAACPATALGCLPLPATGPVAAPAWSPGGRWLAVTVGEPGARRLVVVELGPDWTTAHAVDAGVEDVDHPAWLGDALLMYDGLDDDGVRRPAYVVPGLVGRLALAADAVPGALALRDAHAGTALFGSADGLYVWSLGERAPRRVAEDPGAAVVVGAAGVQARADGVHRIGGARIAEGPVEALRRAGDGAAWRGPAGWWRVDGAGAVAAVPTSASLRAVGFAGAVGFGADARRVGRIGDPTWAAVPGDVVELAVAARDGGWVAAWTASVDVDLPTALGLVRIHP